MNSGDVRDKFQRYFRIEPVRFGDLTGYVKRGRGRKIGWLQSFFTWAIKWMAALVTETENTREKVYW